ncbi:MAG: hypothetical protein R2867_41730 [Caldilineaceae bacterium]
MREVATPVFTPSRQVADYFSRRGYALLASPRLHPGQTVAAAVSADGANGQPVTCNLYIRVYGAEDKLELQRSPAVTLAAGAGHEFSWQIEDTGGAPIAEVGVEVRSEGRADGVLYLDYLTWSGAPAVTLRRPDYDTGFNRFGAGENSTMWRLAWVNGVDQYDWWWPEAYRLVQNEGRGLLMQGSREWTDYQVSATVVPHLATSAGIAARVQGMKRYYALLLCADQKLRLVKALDGDTVLAEQDFSWQFGRSYELHLTVEGNTIRGSVDGQELLVAEDGERALEGGGVALVIEEGRMACEAVEIQPSR